MQVELSCAARPASLARRDSCFFSAPGGPVMGVLHFVESESMEHLAGGGSVMRVPGNMGSVSGHECSIWTEAHEVVAREGDSA